MEPAADVTQAGVVLDGRYRLIKRLGSGGAALVWLADDLLDSTRAAVKILHPHLRLLAEPRRRFTQEAEILAELAHPSIVRTKSFVLEGDRPYIAMEYKEGVTLDQELRSRREQRRFFSRSEVLAILRDIADALDHAHARGVIHRDIKPGNILLARRACILDFGLARLFSDSDGTTVGRVVGTYRYMSPEQAAGERVDHRSDIFSFGLLAYYALTLERPWGDELAAQAMMEAVLRGPRPRVTAFRPELRAEVDRVIARATAVDAAARSGSASVVYRGIARALRRFRVGSGWVWPFVAGAAAASIALALMPERRRPEPVLIPPETSAPRASRVEAPPAVVEEAEAPRSEEIVPAKTHEPQRSARAKAEDEHVRSARAKADDEHVRSARGKADGVHDRLARADAGDLEPNRSGGAGSDRFAQVRRLIAVAESSPEDAAKFRAASAAVRTRVFGAVEDPVILDRWRRMLELADLSYDHAALSQIVNEAEERSR